MEPAKRLRLRLRLQVGVIVCYALALAGMLAATVVSRTLGDKLISGFTTALILFSFCVEIAKYRHVRRVPWRP